MRKQLTYEAVYEEIKRRIRAGVWKPGDRLPTLEELTSELNVGISSVREAVRILHKQKILLVEQGRGTYVREELPAREVVDEHLHFLEQASWLQLAEARLVIEPELAALAADKATTAEADEIVRTAKRMQKKQQAGEDFLKEDLSFHRLIAKASHNEVLVNMIRVISDQLVDSRRLTMALPGMDEKAASFHALIAGAVASRNPQQARELMRLHIQDMIRELTGAVDGEASEERKDR
ncbi:FadR/GntR family transcriptional regulator [Paenibacillus arenilitoris]|uniref:FadR family transcriptional regulator n=1 Tax=Paenibacillus arenilitoris TaxID=2772299 RepID=A0A927H4I7_9BACL|nr:FadR/GntR family transcriptional regulator [Paenibacillus arenilitoris]MBD2867422.1 FadR family transcriptional regulator [Paenibacillus arenilitoris]